MPLFRATGILSVLLVASAFVIERHSASGTDTKDLVVRLLDVGQGDATYIQNGQSRVIIDGGPSPAVFGRYLDSLGLNNSTIDVVILSHQHLDHYSGLRELFKTSRHIHVRYFFENKDP
ncbi:MAG: MBL fold metallo-hydrolase, partial [Gemmatimonadaceae bacterium]